MPLMPFNILGIWLRGLLALAIPILAVLCLKWWYDDSRVVERVEIVRPETVRVEAEPSGQVKATVRRDRVAFCRDRCRADRAFSPSIRYARRLAPKDIEGWTEQPGR